MWPNHIYTLYLVNPLYIYSELNFCIEIRVLIGSTQLSFFFGFSPNEWTQLFIELMVLTGFESHSVIVFFCIHFTACLFQSGVPWLESFSVLFVTMCFGAGLSCIFEAYTQLPMCYIFQAHSKTSSGLPPKMLIAL